ncbi:apicoplast ribosomal protein S14p/S29e precursor, putative [Hepatocystis sp. ex Piliocolobus tephrosceles]|nr:apicoplast ribosomal protein S14p/S29e precursor, putative [Hepatocystis sp. ex Piliocolobus tephrosceles]
MLNYFKFFFFIYFILFYLNVYCMKERQRCYLFLNNYISCQKKKSLLKKISTGTNTNTTTSLNLKKRLDPNDKYTVIKRHEAKIQRNLKRKYMIGRYKEKRELLKKYISDASSPIEYVYWKQKLSSLPRDSCPVRYRNRCAITGRARGYYSFFGLCRHQARALIQKMFFPGFVKASW